jgi:putative transposase
VKPSITRECLCFNVSRRMTSDNGPEFIATALQDCLQPSSVGPLFIKAASPRENRYAQSFYSKVRDEFLGCEVFESVRAATALGSSWRRQNNEMRPHSWLGCVTPAEFA